METNTPRTNPLDSMDGLLTDLIPLSDKKFKHPNAEELTSELQQTVRDFSDVFRKSGDTIESLIRFSDDAKRRLQDLDPTDPTGLRLQIGWLRQEVQVEAGKISNHLKCLHKHLKENVLLGRKIDKANSPVRNNEGNQLLMGGGATVAGSIVIGAVGWGIMFIFAAPIAVVGGLAVMASGTGVGAGVAAYGGLRKIASGKGEKSWLCKITPTEMRNVQDVMKKLDQQINDLITFWTVEIESDWKDLVENRITLLKHTKPQDQQEQTVLAIKGLNTFRTRFSKYLKEVRRLECYFPSYVDKIQ